MSWIARAGGHKVAIRKSKRCFFEVVPKKIADRKIILIAARHGDRDLIGSGQRIMDEVDDLSGDHSPAPDQGDDDIDEDEE